MGFDIGRVFSDIGNAFEDIGQAIETAAKDVGKGIERAVEDVVQTFKETTNDVATDITTRMLGHTSGNPSLPLLSTARYGHVDGQLFLRGKGDQRDIDIEDVRQGKVGDCYFMSSLAALAKSNPEAVRQMIRDNGDGTYTVTFHQRRLPWEPGRGEFRKVEVTVTDELPLIEGRLAFAAFGDSKEKKQELWAALIEKAYATYRGGYGISEGGWPANAMETLTGQNSTSRPSKHVSLPELANHLAHGDVIAASTLPDSKNGATGEIPRASAGSALINDGTLKASHSYTVIGVDVDANTVTIRNPWGGSGSTLTLSYEDFQKSMSEVAWNPAR